MCKNNKDCETTGKDKEKSFGKVLSIDYLETYMESHFKSWVIHLVSLLSVFFSSIIVMMTVWLLSLFGINDSVSWIVGFVVGGIVCSSPLIPVNQKIAKNFISNNHTEIKCLNLTIFNHLFTYIMYQIIIVVLLYISSNM